MEEEKNKLKTDNFVPTDEVLKAIIEEHFADYEDEEEVTIEEVEGLAINIVELNETYKEIEEKQKNLIQYLDQLQIRLNKLETLEEK